MPSRAESAVFSFEASDYTDELYCYAQSTLSEFAHRLGDPVVDSFLVFAQQLHSTGLPICDSSDFEVLNDGEPIGSGATMTVFKSYWRSREKIVAVKKINLGVPIGTSMLEIHDQNYRNMLRSLLFELRVMHHPSFQAHSNFVDLLGVSWERVESDESLCGYRPSIIVELADEKTPTLQSFLYQQDESWTDEIRALAFNLLTDVAEGVTMLHATKIVHGDLKPENVLLFHAPGRLMAKISDFGFCNPFAESRDQIGGTLYWNAPECMPNAPEGIKPYAKTSTRDLYSYGLIVWRTLFARLPYEPEGPASDDEIQLWKLDKDLFPLLRQNITARAPGLAQLGEPILEELGPDHSQSELLWFQIWNALHELLQREPNARNIALGWMHRVFKRPTSKSDVFLPQMLKVNPGESIARIDESSGIMNIRPNKVLRINENSRNRTVARYDVYNLTQIPKQLQTFLLNIWQQKVSSTEKTTTEHSDLLIVLAGCYRSGYGTEPDLQKARELELEAAQAGSDIGRIKTLTNHLMDGIDLPVSDKERLEWLRDALCVIMFPGAVKKNTTANQDRFKVALGEIPEDSAGTCLLHSFVRSHLTDWEILNIDFNGAAEDDLMSLVVRGDLEGLRKVLVADPNLIERRTDNGFTLLHVAADYCHENIIRELIQHFRLSPSIPSDDGTYPVELAAQTGSIESLLLLISLGASTAPLADQGLFTSVAMTGTRVTSGRSPSASNLTMLSLLCGVVEDLHSDEDDPHAQVQSLLNGRYKILEEEIANCGSPLELAISVLNYDSTLALLNLGANPNVFNYMPPLHIAVSLREPVLVALLLAHGADVNIRARQDNKEGVVGVERGGSTALHCADTTTIPLFFEPPRNEVTTYAEFVKEGVEPIDTENSDAIVARVKGCIAVLLYFGADVNVVDAEGETPLLRRIREEDFDVASFLLQKGANLGRDFEGDNDMLLSDKALTWCKEQGLCLEK